MRTILRCCSSADVDDLLDAVDVAREAGDDHATLGTLEEESTQRPPTERSDAVKPGSSALVESAEQQRHALVAERRESRDVGAASVDGREVELEVARVHDDADLGVKGQRVRARHRVGDGDELDLEGTDLAPLAVGDLDEGQVLGDLGLGEAVAGEAQRQRRAVDRDVDVLDEVAQRAGVVLVAVGQDDRVDPVACAR